MKILFLSQNTPSDGGMATYIAVHLQPGDISQIYALKEVFLRVKKEQPALTAMSFRSHLPYALKLDEDLGIEEVLTADQMDRIEEENFLFLSDDFDWRMHFDEVSTELDSLVITDSTFGWEMRDKRSDIIYGTWVLSYDVLGTFAKDY